MEYEREHTDDPTRRRAKTALALSVLSLLGVATAALVGLEHAFQIEPTAEARLQDTYGTRQAVLSAAAFVGSIAALVLSTRALARKITVTAVAYPLTLVVLCLTLVVAAEIKLDASLDDLHHEEAASWKALEAKQRFDPRMVPFDVFTTDHLLAGFEADERQMFSTSRPDDVAVIATIRTQGRIVANIRQTTPSSTYVACGVQLCRTVGQTTTGHSVTMSTDNAFDTYGIGLGSSVIQLESIPTGTLSNQDAVAILGAVTPT